MAVGPFPPRGHAAHARPGPGALTRGASGVFGGRPDDLVAQLRPDLVDQRAEVGRRADLEPARTAQVHRERLLDAARPRRQQRDAVAQENGLLDRVRDVDHRLPELGPDAEDLLLHDRARLCVERGERLIHQEHLGIVGERAGDADPLLHAPGELVRIRLGEPAEATSAKISRARLPFRPRHAAVLGPNATLSTRCATAGAHAPGTPWRSARSGMLRMIDACRSTRARGRRTREATSTSRSRSAPRGRGTRRTRRRARSGRARGRAAVPAEGDAHLAELDLGSTRGCWHGPFLPQSGRGRN